MKKVSLGTVWCANQPPVQLDEMLQRINRECYAPVFEWLSSHDGLKANIAINRSLGELLLKNGCSKTIDYLGKAVERGNVELLGGLAYHPFSPLTIQSKYGKEEIREQNELNDSFNKGIFKELWKPSGFYLPEFGYSDEVGKLVKEMGYKYTTTDAILFAKKNNGRPQPFDRVVQSNGLNTFFISDWSREFAMKRPDKGDCDTRRLMQDMFDGICGWFGDKRGYTVWGYDVETIGHQQKGYGTHTLEMIAQGIRENDMESVFLKDLLEMFPEREHAEIFPGSQSTKAEDIYAGEFFPLWKHSRNKMHERIWDIEDYTMNVVYETARVCDVSNSRIYETARDKKYRGLYSCKAWWANPIQGHFSPWIITKGTDHLMSAIIGCYYILKENNAKIKVNGISLGAEGMLEKARQFEKALLRSVLKEEFNRQME